MSDSRNMVSTTTGGNGEEKTTSSIAIQYRNTNFVHTFFIAFLSLKHVLGTKFITDDFADFCSKKSFISNVQLFLLHRCVRIWLFPKYCPHESFYNFASSIFICLEGRPI